jgi:hypothetical protein
MKRLVGVLLLAAFALAAGLYLFVYAHEWMNGRIEIADGPDQDDLVRRLLVGKVMHGEQFLKPSDPRLQGQPNHDFTRLATTYYHRRGPVGRIMETMNWFPGRENTYAADARMPASQCGLLATPGILPFASLVGLWSEPPYAAILIKDGCLASYARPFQWVDFYERHSALIALSSPAADEQAQFTFIRDARERGANVRILAGPEHTLLEKRAPRQFYQVLVVDTIRGGSDFPSKELLTADAMALYFAALAEDGALLVHISNRTYDLSPVVGDAAASLGFPSVTLRDPGTTTPPMPRGHLTSHWVLVARAPAALARWRTQFPKNPGPGNVRIDWLPLRGH